MIRHFHFSSMEKWKPRKLMYFGFRTVFRTSLRFISTSQGDRKSHEVHHKDKAENPFIVNHSNNNNNNISNNIISSRSSNNNGKDGESNPEQFSGANQDILAQMFRSHPSQRYNGDNDDDQDRTISTKEVNGKKFEYFTPMQEEMNEFEKSTAFSASDDFEKENEFLRKKNEKLRRLKREEEREDQHRHAQHRKYLSHPDLPNGGNIFQRDHMNNKFRLEKAKTNVRQHQLDKTGVPIQLRKDAGQNKWNLSGKKSIAAVVEDQIQVSMLSGEFDKMNEGLKGKPLSRKKTKGVNNTEDIFMDILRRNGIKPEWIQRQQDLNEMERLLKERIESEWALYIMENENRLHAKAARSASTSTSASTSASALSSTSNSNSNINGSTSYDHTPKVIIQENLNSDNQINPILIHQQQIREEFTKRVLKLQTLHSDIKFVNSQIVTYNLQVPSMSLQRFYFKIENLIASVLSSSTMISGINNGDAARQIIRQVRLDGSLGITCLVEFRAEELNLNLSSGKNNLHPQHHHLESGKGGFYPWNRQQKKKERPDPLMFLVMTPIDMFADYISKRLTSF